MSDLGGKRTLAKLAICQSSPLAKTSRCDRDELSLEISMKAKAFLTAGLAATALVGSAVSATVLDSANSHGIGLSYATLALMQSEPSYPYKAKGGCVIIPSLDSGRPAVKTSVFEFSFENGYAWENITSEVSRAWHERADCYLLTNTKNIKEWLAFSEGVKQVDYLPSNTRRAQLENVEAKKRVPTYVCDPA